MFLCCYCVVTVSLLSCNLVVTGLLLSCYLVVIGLLLGCYGRRPACYQSLPFPPQSYAELFQISRPMKKLTQEWLLWYVWCVSYLSVVLPNHECDCVALAGAPWAANARMIRAWRQPAAPNCIQPHPTAPNCIQPHPTASNRIQLHPTASNRI
jgi:hypothetical protein